MRIRLHVQGMVQGVGFRPFVHRLARQLDLSGWVQNTPAGVTLEVEGPAEPVEELCRRLRSDVPQGARIASLKRQTLNYDSDDANDDDSVPQRHVPDPTLRRTRQAPLGTDRFVIRPSAMPDRGHCAAPLPADVATCAPCAREVMTPGNRRFRYPFVSCAQCGPRYSIMRALPYDRARTTMANFPMCQLCSEEFSDPQDRRFHAQTNACPDCGPQLSFWNRHGDEQAQGEEALAMAVAAIEQGRIVAVKGIGGFHLFADAGNSDAILRLRLRKGRPDKPLAVMGTLAQVQEICRPNEREVELLSAPAAPIVLIDTPSLTPSLLAPEPHEGALSTPYWLSPLIAPGVPAMGFLLPYSPLHLLLLHDLARPLIATSGNPSDAAICTDESVVVRQLATIADAFLVHDRPIHNAIDDSVVRVMADRHVVFRRGRGYAPRPIPLQLPVELPTTVAFGGHLKNTGAVFDRGAVTLTPHIGDLDDVDTAARLQHSIVEQCALRGLHPHAVVCDLHPDYGSTRVAQSYAAKHDLALHQIQHHTAHALGCWAENGCPRPALAVVWDGAGLGSDGTVWGGEFLRLSPPRVSRLGSLRSFRLIGGDAAARQPKRAAVAVLYELFGERTFEMTFIPAIAALNQAERTGFRRMLERNLSTPITSSAGRLFDAVAALLGLRQTCSYEGQAALALECIARGISAESPYPTSGLDWGPMVCTMVEELRHYQKRAQMSMAVTARMAARFHLTMAHLIVNCARHFRTQHVLLSGGCFQNRLLVEHTHRLLEDHHLIPLWHRDVPPNDGGLAYGQIVAYAARLLSFPSPTKSHVFSDPRSSH